MWHSTWWPKQKGLFTNYVYKRRGQAVQKLWLFVNVYKVEKVNWGSRWSKKKPKSCQHSLWTPPKQDAIRRISGKCGGKWTSFPLELFFLKSRKGGHLVVTARWFVLVLSYREDGFHNNFVDRTLDRTSSISSGKLWSMYKLWSLNCYCFQNKVSANLKEAGLILALYI